MEKTILDLFKYSRGTYYSWKKEQRPIIKLIEKYFTKEDLVQFIHTGNISRYDLTNVYTQKQFDEYRFFIEKIIDTLGNEGVYLYFSFLDKFAQNLFDDLLNYSPNKSNTINEKVFILLISFLNKYYALEIINNQDNFILEDSFNELSSHLLELDIDTLYYITFNFIHNVPNKLLNSYYESYKQSKNYTDFLKNIS